TIQVMASGRIPGVLEPGERREVPVYLVGFTGQIRFHEPLHFVLDVVSAEGSDVPLDLSSSKDSVRPAGIAPEAWDAIFENYVAQVGPLLAGYVQLLDSDAAYLSRIGEDVTDVGKLNNFAIARADGLHPVHTMATATDASVPAPGLNLTLVRTFAN